MQLGVAAGDEAAIVPDEAVTIIERNQGHWVFLALSGDPADTPDERPDGTLYPTGRPLGVKGCEISQHV